MNVEDSTFADEPVHTDGNSYRNCRFEQCTLIYSGGEIPRLENNSFTECRWVFGERQYARWLFSGTFITAGETVGEPW